MCIIEVFRADPLSLADHCQEGKYEQLKKRVEETGGSADEVEKEESEDVLKVRTPISLQKFLQVWNN